jgi:hypothetical protein
MATELQTVSGTWICPPNVYEITIECWGAGGDSYDIKTLSVSPNETYSFIVGVADYTAGTNTGDTYWVDTSTVFAKGGWDNLEPGLIKVTYEIQPESKFEFQISSQNTDIEIARQINGGSWQSLIILSNQDPLQYLDQNNLINESNYCYRIRQIVSGVAGSWSNISCINYSTTGNPITLSMKSTTNTRSNLQITIPIDGTIPPDFNYELQRKTGVNDDWQLIGTFDKNTLEFLDLYSFVNGVYYYYRIRTYYEADFSDWSNVVQGSFEAINLGSKFTTDSRSVVNISIQQTSEKINLGSKSATHSRSEINIFVKQVYDQFSINNRFDNLSFDKIAVSTVIENLILKTFTNNRLSGSIYVPEHNYMIFQTRTNNRTELVLSFDFSMAFRSTTNSRSTAVISGEEFVYSHVVKINANSIIYLIPIYSKNQIGLHNNTVRIYYNNQVYVFDAIPTNHSAASPIRVMTNEGILSLRKIN